MEEKRLGRWKVLRFHSKDSQHRKKYLCKCICGKVKPVYEHSLKSGKSTSCGCYQKQRAVETHTKHGMTGTRTYNSWHQMIQRCENPNAEYYDNYGGRGIQVCKRWHTFENFLEDMGSRPEGRTLDRVNNDGDYKSSNCRWATTKQQHNNMRVQKRNKLGITGVRSRKNKTGTVYTARITVSGQEIMLYHGPSFFEACCARKEAETNFF